MSWTDNSLNETGFTVQRATDAGFVNNLFEVSFGEGVTNYVDTGLDPSATYFWRIIAKNLVGDNITPGFPLMQASSGPSNVVGAGPSGIVMLQVTVPNGGEIWGAGSTQNVTWTQTGLTGLTTIDLYKGGAFVKTLGTADVTLGTFSWPIGIAEPAGTDYRIRVSQGGTMDESDANFTIVAYQPPKLHLAVKDVIGNFLWMNKMLADETFETWQALQAGTSTAAATAVFNNRLHLIVKDAFNDNLWYQSMDLAGAWSALTLFGGNSPSTPSMAVFNNKLYVAIQDVGNGISCRSMDVGGTWGNWTAFPGATNTTPVLASFNGKLHLVVKDLVGDFIWWNSMDTTETWSGWQLLSGGTPSPVAMAEFNSRLYMFVRGTDNVLYYRSLDTAGTWGGWTMMTGGTSIAPSVAVFNGKLYLVVKDASTFSIWMRSMDNTETFSGWTLLQGGTLAPIALAVF